MARMRFEWNQSKNLDNERKHGVSFEEAQTVFFDERALFMIDPAHADDEDRFLLMGLSAHLRVLLVCHCYRQSDQIIRLISARKAVQSEILQYWNRL